MPTGYPDYENPINIIKQELKELATDVDTTKLDQLGIDLKYQSLSSVDQDIKEQTIAEVIQRPKRGGAQYDLGSAIVSANTVQTLVSVSGKGVLYNCFWDVAAGTDSQKVDVGMKLDGSKFIPEEGFVDFNGFGWDDVSNWIQVLQIGTDAECTMQLDPPTPVTFESSFELYIHNDTANSQSCTTGGWYALL